MSFIVLTDTSGNIPRRLLEQHNIPVIALSYTIDGVEHTCTDVEAFDGESYFRAMKAGKVVTTSQVGPQSFADFFEPWLKQGKDIIFVSMAGGISGTCNSARIAADMLFDSYPNRRIAVIDTKGAALGEGFVALKAAELRDENLGFTEAVARLEKYSERMCNVFTVDDLMFLRRGGRLSNLSALVGTVLNIKPLLKGDETGHIVAFAKLRGRKKAIEALAERYDALVERPERQCVGIVHAGCLADAETLAALIRKNKAPKELMIVGYEPVTGSHVGPGTLALFFEGRDDVRIAIDNVNATQDRLKTAISSVRTAFAGKEK